MKKLITITSFVCVAAVSQAQKRFHTFMYNDKYGITDTLGKEMVKPIHKFSSRFSAKNEIAFYNFNEDIKDIIFNENTGALTAYDYLHPGEVAVKDVNYTQVRDKGKHFLRSENEDKTIALKKKYYKLDNEGKYIIGQYYADPPPAPPVKTQRDKNGKWIPPAIVKAPSYPIDAYGYDIMMDDESLKVLMKGVFTAYLPLYADDRNANNEDDGIVRVEVIELKVYTNPEFSAIIFSNVNTHSLYNADMALVKKFELKNATREQLMAKASSIMKVELLDHDMKTAAPPMVAGPSGPGRPSRNVEQAPKIVYPVFSTKKIQNGNTQFIIQNSETDTKVIFETKHDVRLDTDNAIIRISDDKDNDSKFSYSPSTGALFLPKQYWQSIGLIGR